MTRPLQHLKEMASVIDLGADRAQHDVCAIAFRAMEIHATAATPRPLQGDPWLVEDSVLFDRNRVPIADIDTQAAAAAGIGIQQIGIALFADRDRCLRT